MPNLFQIDVPHLNRKLDFLKKKSLDYNTQVKIAAGIDLEDASSISTWIESSQIPAVHVTNFCKLFNGRDEIILTEEFLKLEDIEIFFLSVSGKSAQEIWKQLCQQW